MGNRTSSPLVSFATVTEKLGSQEIRLLEDFFRGLCGTDECLSRSAFTLHIREPFGIFGRNVASRLFDILDTEKKGWLNFEQYAVGVYHFSQSTSVGRLQMVFSMFDHGSGYLNFQNLVDLILIFMLSADQVVSGGQSHDQLEAEALEKMKSFQPIVETMAEMILSRFDGDGDGKLSPREWASYAQSEEKIILFEQRLTAIVTQPLKKNNSRN